MAEPSHQPYVGRFAPTPSGPLHFGSAVAAVGSFCQARAAGGRWLVRIEDIDPPREQPGAASAILATLTRLGLDWDGEVLYQSRRLQAYREALSQLTARGLTYACTCSRKDVGGGAYPGTCRTRRTPPGPGHALRVLAPADPIAVDDRLQGCFRQDLARELGDFVVWRADGLPAYHLAVVVDDAWQDVSEIVRGGDLLDSTPRQLYLQRLLGLPRPVYLHLPVALDSDGYKLSKQTQAAPVDGVPAARVIACALSFLGHAPPRALARALTGEILAWAVAHWDPQRIPPVPRPASVPDN